MSIPVLVVDAGAHFDSERAVQYFHHSSDNSLKPSVPPHQGRACSLQCHNIPMNKTFFSNFKIFDLQATISRLSGLCFYYNSLYRYQSRQWGNSYSILPKSGYTQILHSWLISQIIIFIFLTRSHHECFN